MSENLERIGLIKVKEWKGLYFVCAEVVSSYELQVTERISFMPVIKHFVMCYMKSESSYHEIPILVAEYGPRPIGFTVTILAHVRHTIKKAQNALW